MDAAGVPAGSSEAAPTTLVSMALLDTFKEKVLDLGRSEARAKVRPLLVEDERVDRSAAGLDRRVHESFVLFWLLSDRALFLVAGGAGSDVAVRIPFEAVAGISLDFDENAPFLPWYFRIAILPEGPGTITTLTEEIDPGNPLAAPPSRALDDEERRQLARGELAPLSGFAAITKKFRTALQRRMELVGRPPSITGAEAADRQRKLSSRRRSR